MSHRFHATNLLVTCITLAIAAGAVAQRPEGRKPRRPDPVKQGDAAPDFTLKTPDGKKTIKLSEFKDKRPVALVFGSYTWPPFRRQVGALNEMHKKYKDDVEFLIVYIREAHPSDGWQTGSNKRDGIVFKQPTTLAGRAEVCTKMADKLGLTIPAIVDTLDDTANKAYAGWPDRLYLVGKDGNIAYQGGRGPWGFKPDALEAAIKTELKD